MRHIQPIKAGIATGTVLGAWHFFWACLVALGWAKPFVDFVLKLHFIAFDYQMLAFSVANALALVALSLVIGAAFGIAFALIWNWLVKPEVEKADARFARAPDRRF